MIDPAAFVHPFAFVCGDVALGARSSVWPFAVVRGDNEHVAAGQETNVQDGAVPHADPGVPSPARCLTSRCLTSQCRTPSTRRPSARSWRWATSPS